MYLSCQDRGKEVIAQLFLPETCSIHAQATQKVTSSLLESVLLAVVVPLTGEKPCHLSRLID